MKAPRHTPSRYALALLAGVAMAPVMTSMPQARAEVGVAAAVNTDAQSQAPGASPRVLALGQKVVFNERISTDASGQAQILLLDGTTFTVGPNSDLAIDEFVFNPNTGSAKVVASVTRGAFRFIGAKTSQSPDGVTINTQVGTIGVRGGSVVCGMSGGQFVCMMPFGKSVDIQAKDGSTHTIFKSGWLLAFDANGNFIEERKAKPQEVGVITAALNGKGNGGTPKPPSDSTVQNSEVPTTNSQLPVVVPVSVLMEAVKTNPNVETVVDNKAQDDIDQDIDENPPGPPTVAARLLTAPPTYTNSSGQTYNNPGPRGLVGTGDNDQIVLFQRTDGRLVANGPGVDINLPDLTGEEGDEVTNGEFPDLYTYNLSSEDGAFSGEDSLAGVVYAGAGDFAAYMLNRNGDVGDPFYLIYGTPTALNVLADLTEPDGGAAAPSDKGVIREYTLTQDPIRSSPLPFFADDLYALQLGNQAFAEGTYDATNLIIVEPGQPGATKAMQTSVSITGAGSMQSSATVVYTGGLSLNETDDEYKLEGGRRGSVRYAADTVSANYRGGIESIGGATTVNNGTGSHFFGPNGENFVIGTPIDDEPDSFGELPAQGSGPFTGPFPGDSYEQDGAYGTHHVASLESETDKVDLSRTSRTVQGFMAGMATSDEGFGPYRVGDDSYIYIDDCTSCSEPEPPVIDVAPNLTVDLNADANSVVATSTVHNTSGEGDVRNMLLAFGEATGGTSAFVDDERFAARRASDPALTRLRLVGNDAPDTDLPHDPNVTAGSYIVSGRNNPIEGYEHCQDCAFIDWGWWGTSVEVDTDPDPDSGYRIESVHMGTWVAGDLSTEAQIYDNIDGLPFGGAANYQGTAIGTVTRYSDTESIQYIARGDVEMNYDFTTRSGDIAINNFDGSDGFDPIYAAGSLYGSQTDGGKFGGNISAVNPYEYTETLDGTVAGSFVNNTNAVGGAPNVAAGMIGSFSLSGTGVGVVGTIAGVGNNPL